MSRSRFIVIIGCGRLGATLANRFSQQGHSVVVVDCNQLAFEALRTDFGGFRQVGDAAELSVLTEAKLNRANALLAVTGEDTLNLMVAQVARAIFGVEQVLARVFDPSREEDYQLLGIDTVSPTRLAADAFALALEGIGPEVSGGVNR